jgi:MFS family permease
VLALFGATAGQVVVWYCVQFYTMYFLGNTLRIDGTITQLLIAAGLLMGTPCFVFFGWLADTIGRKPVVRAGCPLVALTCFPIFQGLTHFGDPGIEAARASASVTVVADPADCHLQMNLTDTSTFPSACNIAKSTLAKCGVPCDNKAAPAGSLATVMVGSTGLDSFSDTGRVKADLAS